MRFTFFIFLPFKLLFKICFEIFDFHSLLLHRIAVTYCHCAVFFGIEIIGYAERCTNLVLTAVSLTDVASVVKLAIVIFAQLCVDLLRAFVQLLRKRKHTNLDWRQRRVETKNCTHISALQLLLIVSAAKERENHTVGSQ